MIVFAFGMALMAGQAAPLTQVETEARYVEQIGETLRQCGMTTEPRRLEYEDVLQEYVLELAAPELTTAHVECLANAPLLDTLTIEFADQRFYDVYSRAHLARPDIKAHMDRVRAEDRDWLEGRGLLEGAPVFDPEQPVSTYTIALEAHCGASPGTMLAADDGTRTVTVVANVNFDQFRCVFGLLSMAEIETRSVVAEIVGEDSEP